MIEPQVNDIFITESGTNSLNPEGFKAWLAWAGTEQRIMKWSVLDSWRFFLLRKYSPDPV